MSESTYVRRKLFNWSLRQDDVFEAALSSAMKMLPRGYGKIFLVRIAHLFLRQVEHKPDEMCRVMLDFVRDVRPMRVTIVPSAGTFTGDVAQRSEPGDHYELAEAAPQPAAVGGNEVPGREDPPAAPPRQISMLWHDDLASGVH